MRGRDPGCEKYGRGLRLAERKTALNYGDTMDTPESLIYLPGFLVYLDRCSPDERSQLCYIIEKIGKRQYFSALRGLAALVKICTDNLQDAIQETL
jgi:hypothetical protein